jgi:hypothetical protein
LGVATFLATCFLMVVLFIELLHGLAWALLHEQIVFKVLAFMGESRTTRRAIFQVLYTQVDGDIERSRVHFISGAITDSPCFESSCK